MANQDPNPTPTWTAENAWHHLFHSNLQGIFIFDMTGRVLSANERFLEIVDFTQAELNAGEISWLKLISPKVMKKAYDARAALVEHGQVGPWEVEFTTRQGQRRAIAFTGTLLPKTEIGLAVLTDLTEGQKAEEMRRNFMLTVAHELRSPMTNVLCFLQLLEKSKSLSAQDRDFLGIANRNARRLAALINSTMEVGRVELIPMPPQCKLVDLRAVLQRVITSLVPQAQAKGLALSNDSPAQGDFTLPGDEERLEQMVTNLLVNAIKYTPRGEVRASVRLDETRNVLELRVQDTGVGIPDEEQKRIFEPFYRVPGDHTQQAEGVGLGLRTVKTVVEQHGGTISLTSQPGQGSTFSVLLPQGGESLGETEG
jgi:PAS domain S-box-containing protein